jgi:hypothetical protein
MLAMKMNSNATPATSLVDMLDEAAPNLAKAPIATKIMTPTKPRGPYPELREANRHVWSDLSMPGLPSTIAVRSNQKRMPTR